MLIELHKVNVSLLFHVFLKRNRPLATIRENPARGLLFYMFREKAEKFPIRKFGGLRKMT